MDLQASTQRIIDPSFLIRLLMGCLIYFNFILFSDRHFLYSDIHQWFPIAIATICFIYILISSQKVRFALFCLIWYFYFLLIKQNPYTYHLAIPIFFILMLYDALFFSNKNANHKMALLSFSCIMVINYSIAGFSKLFDPLWKSGDAMITILKTSELVHPWIRTIPMDNTFWEQILKISTYLIMVLQLLTPIVFIFRHEWVLKFFWWSHTVFLLSTLVCMEVYPMSLSYLLAQLYIYNLFTGKLKISHLKTCSPIFSFT